MEIESFRILKEIDGLREQMRSKTQEIEQQKKRIEQITKQKEKRKAELEQNQKVLKANRQEEQTIENDLAQLDREISRLNENIEKVSEQNQLTALEHQKKHDEDKRELLEAKGLELLELIEELNTKIAEAKTFLGGIDTSIVELTQEVETFEKEKLQEIENLKTRIRNLRDQLPADLLKAHIGLVKEKKDFTITILKNYSCSRCGMEVNRKDESELEKNYGLVRCPGCARIILPQAAYR